MLRKGGGERRIYWSISLLWCALHKQMIIPCVIPEPALITEHCEVRTRSIFYCHLFKLHSDSFQEPLLYLTSSSLGTTVI